MQIWLKVVLWMAEGYLFTAKMPWINWCVASAIEARGLSEPRVGRLQIDLG